MQHTPTRCLVDVPWPLDVEKNKMYESIDIRSTTVWLTSVGQCSWALRKVGEIIGRHQHSSVAFGDFPQRMTNLGW